MSWNKVSYTVKFVEAAQNDLRSIYKYVYYNDCKAAAKKLLTEIKLACETLQSFPSRGHLLHELQFLSAGGYLEIHFKHFRIIYETVENTVYIHAVLDGRRNIQELLIERILNN
ncbi:MAG: type II toxin-antitoxin system RelE/ParE family toxin [Bacteroidetes bacterium]|nr:type II toxin-antitoxin system RelE/ParE family toxin [Bacteroidota bacterium]